MIKTISILFSLSLSVNAFAFVDMPNMDNLPTGSEWAIAMTERACKVDLPTTAQGTITKTSNGIEYAVYGQQGQLLAAASAKSTLILAKKTCTFR